MLRLGGGEFAAPVGGVGCSRARGSQRAISFAAFLRSLVAPRLCVNRVAFAAIAVATPALFLVVQSVA